MVKSGADRSEKYDAKYDPDALMLRWKALRDWSMEKFRETAFKQYLVQYVANKLYEDYEIGYFLRGCMHDKIQKIVFKYDTLTQPQLEAMREDWLREGLPEDVFDVIPNIISEIKPLFEVCVYPRSRLDIKVEIEPMPYKVMFPEKEEFLLNLTEISEVEAYFIEAERTNFGYSQVKVCAHNTVKAVAPILSTPSASFEAIPLWPFLSIAVFSHTPYKVEPTLNIGVVKT